MLLDITINILQTKPLMANILVELKERNKKETISPYILHVDESFCDSDFKKYINTMRNDNEAYSLYICDELFTGTLQVVMDKYSYNVENKITIEFVNEKDKINEFIDLQDSISFIAKSYKGDELFIGCYSSSMKVYRNNAVHEYSVCAKACDNDTYSNLRCIASDNNHVYAYKNNAGIVGLHNKSVVHTDYVKSIVLFRSELFYITNKNECFRLKDGSNTKKDIINPTICYVHDNDIYVTSADRHVYNTSNMSVTRKDYFITSVATCNNCLFYGTSCNALYTDINGVEERYEVGIRYIDFIRVLNQNIVIIGGQYKIQLICLVPFAVKEEFNFDTEISGIEILGNLLMISSGKRIYKKSMHKFM